ncbi:MAG: ATP-binding protein [Bacteroidota bacterium]
MDIKKYFENIDLNEIDRFIQEGQEENLYIEFKTVVHPNYNNDNREIDNKNISKTISGFSNSSGGIIVWGIKAKENEKKQDIATEKKPIQELTKFLNTLNRLEGQAITPVVTGIIHKKIEISYDFGFVISYIPQSEFAPHMANYSGKHYYKRSGDSFYICEHYDIKDMFQRKQAANLDINIKDKKISQKLGNIWRYEMTMSLLNKGRNFAKAPLIKVEINQPYNFCKFGLDGNGNIGVFITRAVPRTPQLSTYIGGQDIVIYPGLDYEVDKIILEVEKDIEELPKLIIDYMIVAENMDKMNFTKEITVLK